MNPTNVKQIRWMRPAVIASMVATGALLSLTFVSGCESQVSAYCAARCTCQGCSQVERADCLDDIEDSQRLAEHDGCADAFSTYMSCYADEGSCSEGAWVSSTCTQKGNALRTCSGRVATFVKTVCAEEKDKRTSCGLGGGGADPCAGVDECAAICSVAATCDELVNTPPESTYVNCVLTCNGSSSSSGGSSGGP
jgi:hypothetical protein